MNREGQHIAIREEGLLDTVSTVVLSGPVLQDIFEEALKRGLVLMPLTKQQRLDKLQERYALIKWLRKMVFCAGAIPVVHVKLNGRALLDEINVLRDEIRRELGDEVQVKVTFGDDGDQ
jgi:hypothetical protein